jgi:hypothetical protein
MAAVTLGERVGYSLLALGPIWFVSGVAVAIQARDASVAPLVWVWSVPVFVFGWVLMGLPLIAMGDLVCRTPKIILGVAGAVAGILVILLPVAILELTDRKTN